MAQNEGIIGTVKSYIPGMTTNTEEHHKKNAAEDHEVHDIHNTTGGQSTGQSGGGILSYIPGVGGGSTASKTGSDVNTSDTDAPRTTRSGTVYNTPDDTATGTYGSGAGRTGGVTSGDYDTSPGSGTAYTGTGSGRTGGNDYSGTGTGTGTGYTGSGVGRTDATGGDYNTGTGSGYGGSKGGIGDAVTTTTGDINNTKTRVSGDEPGYTTKHPSGHSAGTYGTTTTGGSTEPGYARTSDSDYASKPTTGTGYSSATATGTDYTPNTGSDYGTAATGSDYAPKTSTGYGSSTATDYAPKTGSDYGTTATGTVPSSGHHGHHHAGGVSGYTPSSGTTNYGTTGSDSVPTSGVTGGTATGGGYTPASGTGNTGGSTYSTGNPGFGDNTVATTTESDVKGAPIEGENVKGYAVSAPVGTGDVNTLPNSGDPSGQVSGAHMEYGPVDVDTRDATGRGTVGTTVGDGDSSFANVKRNIAHGTEHVVSSQSASRVRHTSTTQH